MKKILFVSKIVLSLPRIFGAVVQLVRISACHAEGRGFESRPHRQQKNVIIHVFIRIRNLMFYPVKEWKTIAAENNDRKTVYVRFVTPLLSMIAGATIVGTWMEAPREVYSLSYVCCKIAILWTSLSVSLYVAAFVIAEILTVQVSSKDHNRSFALLAYSNGVTCLVITLVNLFPFFNEMLVLAFYACYLYWQGIPYMIQAKGQKQMIYGLLSFIIIALIYFLMFFFFGNIFRSILM